VEVILDSLLEDYDPFRATIMSRSKPYTINEIEALLLAQVEHLDKHRLLDPLTSPAAAAASWNPMQSRNERTIFVESNASWNQRTSLTIFVVIMATLVQILFMGLVLSTSDLNTMALGILLPLLLGLLVKFARNLGILLVMI